MAEEKEEGGTRAPPEVAKGGGAMVWGREEEGESIASIGGETIGGVLAWPETIGRGVDTPREAGTPSSRAGASNDA